jgi:hypothetical protein
MKIADIFFSRFLLLTKALNMNRFKKYRNDLEEFKSLSEKRGSRFSINWKDRKMCLDDNTGETQFDRHYVYHMAWAARVLAEKSVKHHVDISSSLHFSTIVSAFIPTDFYDIRPANISLNNLQSKKASLLSLPFESNSIESLSCMHTVEHIGLGRYGDQIDPDGDLKAIGELKRVLSKNGRLLFVVPLGKPKIMFNAHRIYSYAQILEYFSDLSLERFDLIPESGNVGIIYNAKKADADSQNYGCGCFCFTKK